MCEFGTDFPSFESTDVVCCVVQGLRGRRREYMSRGGGTQSLAQMEGEVHGVEGLLRRLK
jgi:hypothetical protein